MRPTFQQLAALGNTPWLPVIYNQANFNLAVAVTLTNGASLTYTIQHTFDEPTDVQERFVAVSQTTTVLTVTDTGPPASSGVGISVGGHGLIVGDSVVLLNTGIGVDGTYAVATVPSATSYTLTSAISQSATGSTNSAVKTFRVFNSTLAASTTRGSVAYGANTNNNAPITQLRLNISVYASGTATIVYIQGMGT